MGAMAYARACAATLGRGGSCCCAPASVSKCARGGALCRRARGRGHAQGAVPAAARRQLGPPEQPVPAPARFQALRAQTMLAQTWCTTAPRLDEFSLRTRPRNGRHQLRRSAFRALKRFAPTISSWRERSQRRPAGRIQFLALMLDSSHSMVERPPRRVSNAGPPHADQTCTHGASRSGVRSRLTRVYGSSRSTILEAASL